MRIVPLPAGSVDDRERAIDLALDVELVVDVADDFLDQVFNGNKTVGPPIFIDDESQMNTSRLHL